MNDPVDKNLPYVHLLQGRDAGQVLRNTAAQFKTLFAGFSGAEIDAIPAPGKWSLREQMCHLADCEVAWAWRLRQAYGEDSPMLQSFEQDPWARAYVGELYTFPAALQAWQAIRDWNLAFLDSLTAADKIRPAVHPSAGLVTLWNLVEIAAGHDLHHLASLQAFSASRA